MPNPVIITCAPTGGIHTPTMSPHLPSNAYQVTKIRGIVEALGYQVATPAQARQRLGLKGADRVTF